MWDRPQLLNTLADLLFAAGAAVLLVAGAIWVLHMPLAPIREASVVTPLHYVDPVDLDEVLQEKARGNFFSLSLENIRTSLESLPWVRTAQVRRVWPERVEVTLIEHRAVARWGNQPGEWVNSYGEVFSATLPAGQVLNLPLLQGPAGASHALLERYGEFSEILKPLGLKPVVMVLSNRHAIGMKLNNGMWLELGREQSRSHIQQRLSRFVEVYPTLIAGRPSLPATVDLRYPNGFALSPVAKLSESRGK